MLGGIRKDWQIIVQAIAGDGTIPCPSALLRAIVCAEDRRFYFHAGVDPIAIVRALRTGLVSQRREGASTIEMQLVRTITGRNEISLSRKLREIILALMVSGYARKRTILQAYANLAYLGFPARGAKAACIELRYNFDELSDLQACEIAARLKVPFPGNSDVPAAAKLRARMQRVTSLFADHALGRKIVFADVLSLRS